jgi:glycosyltransferase involved in cell wall biosynthesis
MTTNKTVKPRIALFAMGVIGGGNLGYGVPVLADLFEKLSSKYEIIYYSFSAVDSQNVPVGIKLRQTRWPLPGRAKFFWTSLKFAWDQIANPCQLIFTVSIYPTAHWALRVGKIFRCPVVVQMIALEAVSLPDIGYGNLTVPWLKKVTVDVCKNADILIAVAEYQKKIAEESLPTQRHIEVLPLRIDFRKFSYKRRNISFPVQFIHIAYYSPIKGQDVMFAAFAKVSKEFDCHLTVIGHGFDIPEVSNMLEQLNITDKVTFTGEIDQSRIPAYFSDAHILLHMARFETGCAVIQEAMASGVAVCGTRVGILSDIGDNYAMVAKPQNVEDITSKIMQVVKDEGLYERITANAYEWIKTYDSEWSHRNYDRFLGQTLEAIKGPKTGQLARTTSRPPIDKY